MKKSKFAANTKRGAMRSRDNSAVGQMGLLFLCKREDFLEWTLVQVLNEWHLQGSGGNK